jgi:hypothetical protein
VCTPPELRKVAPALLSDEQFIAKLRAGADCFEEYAKLLDQVAERMALLEGEAREAKADVESLSEEVTQGALAEGLLVSDVRALLRVAEAADVSTDWLRSQLKSPQALKILDGALDAAPGPQAAF